MARHPRVANIQQVQIVRSRPGEGPSIGFVSQHKVNPDGTTAISLQVNLGTATVPDRRYVANIGAVAQGEDGLTLIFGQTKLGGVGHRSLVLVELSSSGVHRLIRASERMLKLAMQHVERYQVPRVALSTINEDVPGQTVSFMANFATAGFTGRDACMDFYYASPFAVQIAGAGGEFQAEPVVRVTLPTTLMVAIYDRLIELKGELPLDDVPVEEGSASEDRS